MKKPIVAAIVAALAFVAPASAQNYPSRPITIIVPFSAGGPTDALARILGERMRQSLGQPILVENVTGAGGTIGVARAVHAAPDGYTLSIGHLGTHVINGAIYPLNFDVVKDLEPVAKIARNYVALPLHGDLNGFGRCVSATSPERLRKCTNLSGRGVVADESLAPHRFKHLFIGAQQFITGRPLPRLCPILPAHPFVVDEGYKLVCGLVADSNTFCSGSA